MPLHILLTKCDKLKRGAQQAALLQVKREVGKLASIQLFSSTQKIGQKILLNQLADWLAAGGSERAGPRNNLQQIDAEGDGDEPQ